MASPLAAATPSSHPVDVSSTPVRTPLREDAIWKRLREAGFDEESVKRRDKDAILAYVTKLESEMYDYQHNMGLLILERRELVSKYEQVKASFESAEIVHKREEAKWSSTLAEARKREQNLQKQLGIQKECIANIEKALHDNLVESAERKITYESKTAEACAMMEAAQGKFDEAAKKLLASESLQAEAKRAHDTALRTLNDIEAREDEIRRRHAAFKSECDAKEKEISSERQTLYESQKSLHQQLERSLEGQVLLNRREEYITERMKELSLLEKELEEARTNVEEESRALKAERSNFNLEVAALITREEAIVKREAMLDKRERELLILRENIICKEKDERQRIMEEHQALLETMKSELEAEIEQKHLMVKNELESRKTACERREADLCAREKAVREREHAIEFKLSELSNKQEDIASKLKLLEEKEQNIIFTQREAETETQNLEKERESVVIMKLDLEKTRASLEEKKKEIILLEEKLELTVEERNRLLALENELKEEIDSLRAQKLSLVAEFDKLKAEKDKFENEWELIDEKKEALKKEEEKMNAERKAATQHQKNEYDSIKLEKEILHEEFKREIERLSREREEFVNEMDRQHSDWFSKIQQERDEFVRDINIQRTELENNINNRREEIETYMREREAEFEQEKAKEFQLINSQKEMIAKQLEHAALEMQKLNNERMEIAQDREQREREWAEIKNFMETLGIQCEKLKKQRELLHADREEINQQIQRLKYLEDLHIEYENRSLSAIEEQPTKCKTPVVKKCQCSDTANAQFTNNGPSSIKLLSQGPLNASTSTSDTKSWIRKCTEVVFKHSLEKDSVSSLEKSVGNKIWSKIREYNSPELEVQNTHVIGKKVCIHEEDNCQDLSGTPNQAKSNRHEQTYAAETQNLRENLYEQKMKPIVINAGSPSEVEENKSTSNHYLGNSGRKSKTLLSSVNSLLLGRKRPNSHGDVDIQSGLIEKQAKRARQNLDSEDSSLGGGSPVLTSQDINGVAKKEEQILDKDDITEKLLEDANVSAGDLIVNALEQDKLNRLADEFEDDEDFENEIDDGEMSVKQKIWKFMIT